MKGSLQHITILILAIMLSMMAGNSIAQILPVNTGDDPYLGTSHSYLVEIDQLTNNYAWELISGATTYNPIANSDFITTSLVGNSYTITIEFTRADFTPGTWTLRYEEENQDDGCVATREYTIQLSENEFYESLYDIASETPPGAFSACHDSTNTVQQYVDVNGINFQTAYIFPVYMYKESDFKLATWHFDAGLSISGTGYSIVTVNKASENTNQGAAYTISESGGKYTVVADSATGNYESDYVELRVVVTGPMFNNADLTLEIENGYAISGSTGQVTTEDNVHIYPDESGSPADWRTKTVTINGVPQTLDIAFGTGETAWSAQNPLQSSTHNYTVQMGNTANARLWQIIDDSETIVDVANYVLSTAISGSNSNAAFTFNMDPGAYTLVFTETSGNGCISIRHYPIVLGGPFVVSIAEVADRCATASGNIYPGLQQTDTEITYTVTLNTSNYYANWEFEFDVASNLGFTDPDLTYTVSSVSTGASYNSSTGLVSVSNSQASPLTVVQVVVTYTGHYENEHTITAGVNNATGSFYEQASDVSEENIIYAMPQAGELAGVD